MLAVILLAVVNICFAPFPGVTVCAAAFEPPSISIDVDQFTGSIIVARIPVACIDLMLADLAIPPGWTLTTKVARAITCTLSIVDAGIAHTSIALHWHLLLG